MKKFYDLIVENEIIPWGFITINKDGIAMTKEHKNIQNIFDNFSDVIDISKFNYIPKNGAIWDGLNFSKEYELENMLYSEPDVRRFAFIDKSKKFLGYLDFNESTPLGSMMTALFLSNPLVAINRVEHD